MERSSTRHRYSRSRSLSQSHSRSRSRSRDRNKNKRKRNYSDRNDDQHRFNRKKKRKCVRFDKSTEEKEDKKQKKKEKKKEDFNVSGALKRDLETTKNGVVLKYNEPPEGCKCSDRKYRLYEYKNDQQENVYYIHRKSWYLIGRDERV